MPSDQSEHERDFEFTHWPRGTDDPDLAPWLYGLVNNLPTTPGDFLKELARAALRADTGNYPLLRPAMLQLKAKYPEYRDPDAVPAKENP